MDKGKINVLVVSRLDLHPTYMEDIAAVSPRISVKDGVAQFVAELKRKGVTGPNVDRLEQQARLVKGSDEPLDKLLAEAEVVFWTMMLPDNLFERAPKLKWIHLANVGVDRFLSGDLLNGKVIFTNSRGGVAVSIAENVMMFILGLAKNVPRLMANKEKRLWDRFTTLELRDRTVGLIGLGAIGSEIAKLSKGMQMRVIATKRSATKREKNAEGIDEIYPSKELPDLIRDSDFLVIAAPLTDETRGLIGEKELRSMKSTSYIINIARGPIIKESALIKALKEGWIAGAGLDVFEVEPLPRESELWSLPNVILSSHSSGTGDRRSQRLVKLFCDNLRKYVNAEELFSVITREKAY